MVVIDQFYKLTADPLKSLAAELGMVINILLIESSYAISTCESRH